MSVQRHEDYKTGNAATSPSGVYWVMPKHRAWGYSRDGKNYSNCSTPYVWNSSHPLCTQHNNILRQVNSMFCMFRSKFTRWFEYDRDWFFLNHNYQTLAHVSLQRTSLRSQHNFSNVLEASWWPFQKRLVVGGVSTPQQSANRMPCKSDLSLPNR